MSEVEKRLNSHLQPCDVRAWDAQVGGYTWRNKVSEYANVETGLLRDALTTLQSQARALREAADVARMTAYHIEKTKRPTNGHRAMWIASLAPIARSALSEGSGSSRELAPPDESGESS